MTRTGWLNWLICLALMAGGMIWLGWGKPVAITGLFVAPGLAVGSLYALGGIGMDGAVSRVGVLNFASGSAGAAGAMTAWQLVQWGWWPPLSWLGCIAVFAGSDPGLWPPDRAAAGLARNRGEGGGNAGVRADPAGAGRLSLAR